MTLDPAIAWTLRLSLALLFATAAWHKLSDRAAFAGAVRAYELVPSSFAVPLSWLLPSLECVIAVGLVLPELRKASAIAAGGLLSLYTFAIAASLWRGKRDIDCGCFGFVQGAKTQLSPGLIARNLALVVASGMLLVPVRARGLLWIDALTVAMSLLGASLLWGAVQRLLQNGPELRRLGGAR